MTDNAFSSSSQGRQRAVSELEAYIAQVQTVVDIAYGNLEPNDDDRSPLKWVDDDVVSSKQLTKSKSSSKLKRRPSQMAPAATKPRVATDGTAKPSSLRSDTALVNPEELQRLDMENMKLLLELVSLEQIVSSGGRDDSPLSSSQLTSRFLSSRRTDGLTTAALQSMIANTITEAARLDAQSTRKPIEEPPPITLAQSSEVATRNAIKKSTHVDAVERLCNHVFAPLSALVSQEEAVDATLSTVGTGKANTNSTRKKRPTGYSVACSTSEVTDRDGLGSLFPSILSIDAGHHNDELKEVLEADECIVHSIGSILSSLGVVDAHAPSDATTNTATVSNANASRIELLIALHSSPSEDVSIRACPAAIQLLQRFVECPRFPVDFRGGVAPSSSRFEFPEDPLLAAFPGMHLPTYPLLMCDAEPTSGDHDRLHHAWLMICERSIFLIVDHQDTLQQLAADRCAAHEGVKHADAATSPDQIEAMEKKQLKRLDKLKVQREKTRCSESDQYWDGCFLIPVVSWRDEHLGLDLSPQSLAFTARMTRDACPLLFHLPAPRLDRLVELYPPNRNRVDKAEMAQQYYQSLVLQSLPERDRRREKSRFSFVFLDETAKTDCVNLLWATMHPTRGLYQVGLPSPVRCLHSLLPDGNADTQKTSKKDSGDRTASKKDSDKKRMMNPVSLLHNSPLLLSDESILHVSSPLIRYTEMARRSSSSDWYPTHHALSEMELQFCRSMHVHPQLLIAVKQQHLLLPDRRWMSWVDIAAPLMGASNSNQMDWFTTERMVDMFVKMGLIEPVDIIRRLPIPSYDTAR